MIIHINISHENEFITIIKKKYITNGKDMNAVENVSTYAYEIFC